MTLGLNLLNTSGLTAPPWWGWAGFLGLLLLPGAWISFGLRLRGLSFWPRLFTGLMLSPLVVLAQFCLVRTLGASFETAAPVLVVINLPAIYLICRRTEGAAPSNWRIVVLALLLVILASASLSPQIAHPERRIYIAHTWLYTDAAYGVTRGFLVPEDAQFAGQRLAYPVPGELVYRAVLGYLVQSTPAASYIWANLVWLIAVCGFSVGLVMELGGEYVAQLAAAPWLLFGINPLGYLIRRFVVGSAANERSGVWGDLRWTSWLLKYIELNTMPVVLGMFIGMTYLLLRLWSRRLPLDLVVVLALLLCSVGMLYPILFPPGCALIGAAALSAWYEAWQKREPFPWVLTVELAIVLVVATIVTFGHLAFLIEGRKMAGGAVHLSDFRGFVHKSIELLVVTTPLLAGLAMVFRCCWNSNRRATLFLLLSVLGSAVLYPVFFLPYWSNEYKYLFTGVICLAPFAALAMDQVWKKLPRVPAMAVIGVTLGFVITPYVLEMIAWKDFPKRVHPIADTSGFYMRLDNRERLAGVCDAIRTKTPLESVLVVQKPELHFPTVTDRSLYVAPEQNFAFAGVNQLPDVLLVEIRGYPQKELDARRTAVSQLFTGDIHKRENSLNRILELRRPVAILTEPEDDNLLSWLQAAGKGHAVYEQDGRTVWLVPPAGQQKN